MSHFLLFYHLKLRCYIIVELKTKEFIPEYAGKMNFYLSAIDDMLKTKDDNPSIGLILCKNKNKFTAQFGISSYELSEYLPKDVFESLPTEEDLNLHIDINE